MLSITRWLAVYYFMITPCNAARLHCRVRETGQSPHSPKLDCLRALSGLLAQEVQRGYFRRSPTACETPDNPQQRPTRSCVSGLSIASLALSCEPLQGHSDNLAMQNLTFKTPFAFVIGRVCTLIFAMIDFGMSIDGGKERRSKPCHTQRRAKAAQADG